MFKNDPRTYRIIAPPTPTRVFDRDLAKCARKGCDRLAPMGKILCGTCGTVHMTDTLDNMRVIDMARVRAVTGKGVNAVTLAERMLKRMERGDSDATLETFLEAEGEAAAVRLRGYAT